MISEGEQGKVARGAGERAKVPEGAGVQQRVWRRRWRAAKVQESGEAWESSDESGGAERRKAQNLG